MTRKQPTQKTAPTHSIPTWLVGPLIGYIVGWWVHGYGMERSGQVRTETTTTIAGVGEETDSCAAWALQGECTRNPSYMLLECRDACAKQGTVEMDYEKRCPAPTNQTPSVAPGDIDVIMRDAMHSFGHLEPELLS